MQLQSKAALRAIRLLHTIIWAFFAAVIMAMPVVAWQKRFSLLGILAGVVLVEILILAANRMRCPLTDVAGRYTDDRRENFDIYLPLFVAKYNKQIFGALFLFGLLVGLVRWLAR